MTTWLCRRNEMLFRPNYKNIKIIYMTLLLTIMIFEKRTTAEEDGLFTTLKEDLYFIVRIQRQFIATKRRWFSAQYSHIRFVLEDLHKFNIYAFDRFEMEGHIEQFQCDFRLFKLERDALHALFRLALQS